MKGGLPIDSTASLSRKDVSFMGFEIILWDEEVYKSVLASPENKRLSLIKNLLDSWLQESKRRVVIQTSQCTQRP